MTTTTRKKAIQDDGVIRVSSKDWIAMLTALDDDNPSMEKYEKLRQAIQLNRKMAETK